MIKETLIMDDMYWTNCFGLPLVGILAIDEHKYSQLVAFTFLPDRTTESFENVDWPR
jgi:hypothetical protein